MKITIEEKTDVVEAEVEGIRSDNESHRLILNNLTDKLLKLAEGKKKIIIEIPQQTT